MLYKLLKHKMSRNQLIGFTLANLVGLSIIFIGIQIYSDLHPILNDNDSFLQDEYIILTKKVNTVGSILGKSPSFSKKEINSLKDQSFIQDVGLFEASHFNIRANINFIGKQFGIATDMFFESVPDNFIDVESTDWIYNTEKEEIPIIIPRSYLDLYNFGFAASKSLPKVSEGLINSVVLDINASGNGQFQRYKGRIIGFSKRINTILVPESFLKEANSKYSTDKEKDALRVIIKVKNSSDPQLSKFIADKGYIIDGNQLDTGKARYFLNISISIVLFIGLLISVLACYILILSIYLLVEKNIYSLENLSLLGYSNTQIARPYLFITMILVSISSIIAIIITKYAQSIYIPFIKEVTDTSIASTLSSSTLIFALVLFIGILIVGFLVINTKIKSISTFKNR